MESIIQNPRLGYRHALNAIKGRWTEAEPFIMKDPQCAYYYASAIIKGRRPEAEPFIYWPATKKVHSMSR